MRLMLLLIGVVVLASTPGLRGQPKLSTKDSTKEPPSITEVGGRTLEEWKKELMHRDPSVREEAIRAIAGFGAAASSTEVIRLILGRCLDADALPRCRACQALALLEIRPEDRRTVVEILGRRLTEDPQVAVRYAAGMTLTRYGEDCDSIIPLLLKGTADPSSFEVRRVAVMTLATAGRPESGPPNPAAVNGMLKALKDPALQVRLEGLRGLAYLGKPGEPALQVAVEQALRAQTLDRNKLVAIWAWVGFMATHETNVEAVKAIAAHLKHDETRIRIAAAGALGMMGTRSKFAVPELLELLKDPDLTVVAAGINALAQIEDPGLKVVTTLTDLSQDKDAKEYIRDLAKNAVDHIKKNRK